MAVHCIDEPTIEIGKPITCGCRCQPPYRAERGGKGEQKALALKRFQDENSEVAEPQLLIDKVASLCEET